MSNNTERTSKEYMLIAARVAMATKKEEECTLRTEKTKQQNMQQWQS